MGQIVSYPLGKVTANYSQASDCAVRFVRLSRSSFASGKIPDIAGKISRLREASRNDGYRVSHQTVVRRTRIGVMIIVSAFAVEADNGVVAVHARPQFDIEWRIAQITQSPSMLQPGRPISPSTAGVHSIKSNCLIFPRHRRRSQVGLSPSQNPASSIRAMSDGCRWRFTDLTVRRIDDEGG
jgi:hypothetical protein